ncbi:MAG: hypothetical protein ABFD82_03120 [Syntrophaceae bacterium]
MSTFIVILTIPGMLNPVITMKEKKDDGEKCARIMPENAQPTWLDR